MTTDAQTIVGIIDEAKFADGESDRGEWRRWDFRIRSPAGTKRYSTFDKGWPTNLKTGKTYRFTYMSKQSGEYTNLTLTSATEVDPSEFGAQPASNGEFQQPYEPPTDEAKARVATGEPQAEYKSPSRSYDQNQDIQERAKDRRTALMQAVEYATTLPDSEPSEPGEYVRFLANQFFVWLRETATDVRSSPADPTSDAQGTEDPEIGWGDVDNPVEAESDGQSAFFPGAHKFANAGEFRKALAGDFGLKNAPDIEAELKRLQLPPLAELRNLDEAYDIIAHDRKQQAAPAANTEA